MYALFKDGKQITKAHSTERAVRIEAYERKLVVSSSGDFSIYSHDYLADGLEIKQTSVERNNDEHEQTKTNLRSHAKP